MCEKKSSELYKNIKSYGPWNFGIQTFLYCKMNYELWLARKNRIAFLTVLVIVYSDILPSATSLYFVNFAHSFFG